MYTFIDICLKKEPYLQSNRFTNILKEDFKIDLQYIMGHIMLKQAKALVLFVYYAYSIIIQFSNIGFIKIIVYKCLSLYSHFLFNHKIASNT